MREVIHIHIGGAGCRLGAAYWELLCLEHGILPDGQIPSDKTRYVGQDQFNAVFSKEGNGKRLPRALFVDPDPSAMDTIRKGSYSRLFRPEQFVTGHESAAGNYARGYKTVGETIIDETVARLRQLANACQALQGFVITHAIGGGTGSGLGALLLERLNADYGNLSKLSFTIFPSTKISSGITEPYNAVLGINSLIKDADASVVLDNNAVIDICQNSLGIAAPSYADVNLVMARLMSDIMAPTRFGGGALSDLTELPSPPGFDPQLRLLTASSVPVISPAKSQPNQFSIEKLTEMAFSTSLSVKYAPGEGKHLACYLVYRGHGASKDINTAIAALKTKPGIQLDDQCLATLKTNIVEHPPAVPPQSRLAAPQQLLTIVSNTTAITKPLSHIGHKFDLMYDKRAFAYLYTSEGMMQGDFQEAREALAQLEDAYKALK